MILIAGITAMKDTVSPLLGQAPEPELVDEIKKIVRCDKRILGIHDLVSMIMDLADLWSVCTQKFLIRKIFLNCMI